MTRAVATSSDLPVLIDASLYENEAVNFWLRRLGGVTEELRDWFGARAVEIHHLRSYIHRMNRSRRMWRQLSDQLEARDPTNPWTRNYDGLYLGSQVMAVAESSVRERPKASAGCAGGR